jgi:hypothetical protein
MTRMFESLEHRKYFAANYLSDPSPVSAGLGADTLAIADLNHDGKLDIVSGNDADMTILLGNGSGAFTHASSVATLFDPFKVEAVDLNGDGHADLVASSTGSAYAIARGNGDGTFAAFESLNYPSDVRPDRVFDLADVNGDGKIDLVTTDKLGGGGMVILYNQSSPGGAIVFDAPHVIGDSTGPTAAGDVNGDGKVDLVTRGSATAMRVHLQGAPDSNGRPQFDAAVVYHSTYANHVSVLKLVDVNGDGKLDMAVSYLGGTTDILLNDGTGVFGQATRHSLSGDLADIADIDSDGHVDLIGTSVYNNRLSVARGNGDGTFAAPENTIFSSLSMHDALVGDLDGDGRNDLVVTDGPDARIAILKGRSGNNGGNGGGNGGGGSSGGNDDTTPPPPAAKVFDLSASFKKSLPATVLGGSKGKASINVANLGNGNFKGSAKITLFASGDPIVDASDAAIVTMTKKLDIKAGKAKKVDLSFKLPADLGDGAYHLLAQVEAAGESNAANNVAAAAPVTIQRPFVDVSAVLSKLPGSLVRGKKAEVSVKLDNLGNVEGKGRVQIQLFASNDGVTPVGEPLATLGKSVKLKLKVPDSLAGQTNLVAVVTPQSGLADASVSNNQVGSGVIPIV